MKCLVVGGTGAIGRFVVAQLLGRPASVVERVVCIGRRPVAGVLADSGLCTAAEIAAWTEQRRLVELEVDFAALADAAGIAQQSQTALVNEHGPYDALFCTLGTTRARAGSAAAFRRIDHDYVVAALNAYAAKHVLLVTACNANARAWALYPRVKGEVEQAARALHTDALQRVTIVRPALLLTPRARRDPDDNRPLERLAQRVLPALSPLMPRSARPVRVEQVASAMLHAAIPPDTAAADDNAEVRIDTVENAEIYAVKD